MNDYRTSAMDGRVDSPLLNTIFGGGGISLKPSA